MEEFLSEKKATDEEENVWDVVGKDSKFDKEFAIDFLPEGVVVIGSFIGEPKYLPVQQKRQGQDPKQAEWVYFLSFFWFP